MIPPVRTAVILAAGLGSRLGGRTASMPKGFLEVGGRTLIERSLDALSDAGISRFVIGTGHAAGAYESLSGRYPGMVCVYNPKFERTGSMFTLYSAKAEIHEDFLLLESDLIYDPAGLRLLLEDPVRDVILSSGLTDAGDGVYIEADGDNRLISMSKRREDLGVVHSELVGITKLSVPALSAMCEFAAGRFAAEPRLDYEHALVGISRGTPVKVSKVDGYLWGEVDDESHLRRVTEKILPAIERKRNEKDQAQHTS